MRWGPVQFAGVGAWVLIAVTLALATLEHHRIAGVCGMLAGALLLFAGIRFRRDPDAVREYAESRREWDGSFGGDPYRTARLHGVVTLVGGAFFVLYGLALALG